MGSVGSGRVKVEGESGRKQGVNGDFSRWIPG